MDILMRLFLVILGILSVLTLPISLPICIVVWLLTGRFPLMLFWEWLIDELDEYSF